MFQFKSEKDALIALITGIFILLLTALAIGLPLWRARIFQQRMKMVNLF